MKGSNYQFTASEISISTERHEKFAGSVKAYISQITFNPPLTREIDSKRVDNLKKLFAHQHCDRFDTNNHVPVKVARQSLEESLQGAGIDLDSLQSLAPKDLPLLNFPSDTLVALHGRHRIKAALDTLFPDERWWTVDLYYNGEILERDFRSIVRNSCQKLTAADISSNLEAFLVDEYKNESIPSDGEIYRSIRQYEMANNHPFRRRWYMRLSKTKRDRLDQLDNPRNRDIRNAFDALLPIRGLWGTGMRISLISRIIASYCTEEVVSYLNVIRHTWTLFALGDSFKSNLISTKDVEELQLLRTHHSCPESREIQQRILRGDLFSAFNDNDRNKIALALNNFDGLIPSLFTFFEDFKVLESWSSCIKRLFGPLNSSIRDTMRRMLRLDNHLETNLLIQVDEFKTKSAQVKPQDHFELAYRQIWLYIARHYAKMPADTKNAGNLLVKQDRSEANSRNVFQLADLASRLQFCSPEISHIISHSPDRLLAQEVLKKARDPSYWTYDEYAYEGLIHRIVECFDAAQPASQVRSMKSQPVARGMRCGMPKAETYVKDVHFMYLDFLYGQKMEVVGPVSSLLVLHWVFSCFFGPFEPPSDLPWSAKNPNQFTSPITPHKIEERRRGRRKSIDYAHQESRSRSPRDCENSERTQVRQRESRPMQRNRPLSGKRDRQKIDRTRRTDQNEGSREEDIPSHSSSYPHFLKRQAGDILPSQGKETVSQDSLNQHEPVQINSSTKPPQSISIPGEAQRVGECETGKQKACRIHESTSVGEGPSAHSETSDGNPKTKAGQKRKNEFSVFDQGVSSKLPKLEHGKENPMHRTVNFLRVKKKGNNKKIEHLITIARVPELIREQAAKYEDNYYLFVGRTRTSSDQCAALMEQQNKFTCYLASRSQLRR